MSKGKKSNLPKGEIDLPTEEDHQVHKKEQDTATLEMKDGDPQKEHPYAKTTVEKIVPLKVKKKVRQSPEVEDEVQTEKEADVPLRVKKKVRQAKEADISPEVEDEVQTEKEADVPLEVEDEVQTEKEADVPLEVEDEVQTEKEAEVSPEVDDGASNIEQNDIPPIAQIRKLLADFEIRVPVWGLTVFTVDGYILAHRLFYDKMPENIEMVVSSMSAGLITISEDFIRMVDAQKEFRQVLVDAEDPKGDVSFSILLKHVTENVMMACIFPSDVQLGLVTFEIENLSQDIVEIVKLWDVKLHEETVT
ncbi:MAG: hypothetical protein ACXABC_11185 [Candidatus Thorarchaeota archaeon]|jgi:predicted regulator of Ras-like GTPase activity (Roadblock/LC7/MglB family)